MFSGRVFALKNVRLFFTKGGRMKFVSHLDMNRFMIRIIRRSGIPIWYTEGFNPHPYITFALPLSLGFESDYEILDLRLTDDCYPIESLPGILNAVSPEYIRFFDAAEPILKTGAVAYADYEITFDDGGALERPLKAFCAKESIICRKKTKKGDIKEFDIIPKIAGLEISVKNGNTVLSLILPAGSQDNVNPELLLSAFFEEGSTDYYCYSVKRRAVLDKKMQNFR